jgi:thiosulfate dehydrogenase
MHRVDTAAAFIRHNMPLGLGDTLTEQEAWDLAQFINSHERPQDPRFAGDLEETAREYHNSAFSLYGKAGLDGSLLGSKPAVE